MSGASYKIRVPKAPPRLLVEGAKLPRETGYISAGNSISNKQRLVKVSRPQGIGAQFSSRLWITLKSSKLKLLDISRAMEQSMLNRGHDQVERVFTSSVYLSGHSALGAVTVRGREEWPPSTCDMMFLPESSTRTRMIEGTLLNLSFRLGLDRKAVLPAPAGFISSKPSPHNLSECFLGLFKLKPLMLCRPE